MPYLAVDLDAKKKVPLVARACGVPVGEVIWGLLELWEYVWSTKSDRVSAVVVAGCFGEVITPATLEAFGFLEMELPERCFRVRGADRYLRVSEARRKGAEATNKKRAERRSSVASERSSDAQAHAPERTTNALTPSTEHRAPNRDEKQARATPDARWKPLVQSLEAAFRDATGNAYRWQGAKDGAALKRLLAAEAPEEILRRWRVGLKGEGWRHTATVAQLGAKWNDLATTSGPARAPADPLAQGHRTEGPITATEVLL